MFFNIQSLTFAIDDWIIIEIIINKLSNKIAQLCAGQKALTNARQ